MSTTCCLHVQAMPAGVLDERMKANSARSTLHLKTAAFSAAANRKRVDTRKGVQSAISVTIAIFWQHLFMVWACPALHFNPGFDCGFLSERSTLILAIGNARRMPHRIYSPKSVRMPWVIKPLLYFNPGMVDP